MSTAIDTDLFRKRLLEERARVQEALDYLHDENPGSIQDETQDSTADNHPGDMATVTFDRELDYTLEENEGRLLQAIDAALKRMDDGTYGICVNCGKPIPEERLAAVPYAVLCLQCKREEEEGR